MLEEASVAAAVPSAGRAAIVHAARAGTTSGLNDVLLTAAAIAILGAIAAAFIHSQPAVGQLLASPGSRSGAIPVATADTPSPRA